MSETTPWERIVEAGAKATFDDFRRKQPGATTNPGEWEGLSEDGREYHRSIVRPILAAAFAAAEEEARQQALAVRGQYIADLNRKGDQRVRAEDAWAWLRTLRPKIQGE